MSAISTTSSKTDNQSPAFVGRQGRKAASFYSLQSMWFNALLAREILGLTCLANGLENMWWMPLKTPAWQSLSAMVSLHLGTSRKMLLNWVKVAGTLAVCLLVGFHLSPAIACCRHHSPPFAPGPMFLFCFCFFSFGLRRSWVRNVYFGKRRKKKKKEDYSGIVKKNATQVSTKSHFKESWRALYRSFFNFFSENKDDRNSWRL